MKKYSARWRSKLFALFAATSVAITASAQPVTNVISLSFGAEKSSVMDPSESAGVVAVTNWNSVSNATGSASALLDNFGATTTVAVSYNSPLTWSIGMTNTPGDFRMMKGYLDTASSGANASVTISGIPTSYSSAGYDVIVYCDGDNGSEARVAQYTIGTTSIYNLDASRTNFTGTFTQSAGTSDQGTNTPAGNYVRFTGLTNSGFTLSGVPGSTTGQNARAPINAIQIVAAITPLPPIITLSPTSVCPYTPHNQAIAPDGMAGYFWSVTNASISTGTGNNQTLLYDVGNTSGFVGITLFVTNSFGQVSSNSVQVPINATPGASIQVAGPVCAGSTGNTATVITGTNAATFAWSIANGTITSATNIQNITFTAGNSGTVAFSVLVTSDAGCIAGDYTEATITAPPTATITAPSIVLVNSTNTANGPAGADSYSWIITNGTILGTANAQVISFVPGSSGSVGLTLAVANDSGCSANTTATIPIQGTNIVIGDALTNWITSTANQYVRLYTNNAAKNAGVSVITWNYTSIDGTNVDNKQPLPVYSGVQAIYSSSNFVYIRSSGMPASTLGPLLAYAPANLILPTNQHSFFRFPRTATVPAKKSLTTGGAIGFMVDGAIMFDIRDALVWNGSTETMNTGTNGYWCRDAYVNEGYGFDPVGGHAAPGGGYHYHANPMALRYRLGDHMTYNVTTKFYSEATNAATQHSPIIGWVADGFPVYGPYGYSNALDPNSGIRRMVSGFVLRNGQNGTANITLVGRTNIPAWAQRVYGVSLATGPSVNSSYPLGRYLEDHDFLGDLTNPNTGSSYIEGVDYDLDEYNGRFCVTPEFPNGVYAYFVTIDTNGTPAFPYYIGRALYGSPTGGNVQTLTESVTTNFVGVPNIAPTLKTPLVAGSFVTLSWSATEGGNYRVESSSNLTTWATNTSIAPAMLTLGSYTEQTSNAPSFYRVSLTSLASYDPVVSTNSATGGGGGGTITMSPNSGTRGQTVTVTATISASSTPPPPPQSGAPVQSFTVGGIAVTGATYTYNNGSGTVTGSLVIPANAATGPQTVTITFSPPPGQQNGPSYTQQNGFTVN